MNGEPSSDWRGLFIIRARSRRRKGKAREKIARPRSSVLFSTGPRPTSLDNTADVSDSQFNPIVISGPEYRHNFAEKSK
ncbi:Hypothetical protein NTJ_08072 [Nesidiocoris tenuis]|uniref:Uncharacterized protein n=1 Tax=Nesidiocoris tenuis TaxID=355587 RepID=A0ABN7AST0_9HEMI|nr:Hypothetical protein NTJ_08072 [Nesidiocoris tenuis]